MDRTLVALDLETTGLTPRLDRIIEVGAVRFRGDEVLATFQSLVRPEVAIPRAVQELTGIRDADVVAAPPPEEVLAHLIDFVGESGVVAHSGNFDLSFMVNPNNDAGYELFDTLDLARIMLPMAPSHSLPHLSRQLGLTHAHPHRALSDADAARQLFRYLWHHVRGFPQDLLGRMLDVTEGWPHPLHQPRIACWWVIIRTSSVSIVILVPRNCVIGRSPLCLRDTLSKFGCLVKGSACGLFLNPEASVNKCVTNCPELLVVISRNSF